MKSILPLALGLAFFGALVLAAHFFPRPYDWRYDVMSLLAEPRDNPHAYLVACAGLALSGVLMLFFPTLLHKRLAADAPNTARASGWFLYLAAVLLTLSGILPGHVDGLGRAHEDFAHAYGVAIALATLGYACAALRLPRRFWRQRLGGIVFIVIPLSGFGVSRLSLLVGGSLVSPAAYRALKDSVWNSLSLWEWIAAVGTYLFFGLLMFLPENSRRKGDG